MPVIEEAFSLTMRAPWLMVAVSAIFALMALLAFPLTRQITQVSESGPKALENLLALLPSFGLAGLIEWVAQGVLTIVWLRWVADLQQGTRRTPRELLGEGLRRLVPMTLVNVAVVALIGIGSAMCVVPGVLAYSATILAAPAVVFAAAGPLKSIQLSLELTRGSLWKLGVIFSAFGFASIGAAVAGLVLKVLLSFLGTSGDLAGAMLSAALYGPPTIFLAALQRVTWIRVGGAAHESTN
jgi:hypothetical protein